MLLPLLLVLTIHHKTSLMDIGPADEEGGEGGGGGGGEDYEIEEDLEYNNNADINNKDNSNEIASSKAIPSITSSISSSVSSVSILSKRSKTETRHRKAERNHHNGPRTHLTVQCKSKFEQHLEKRPADSPSVPYLATFIKWLATILLGLIFLTSLVFSRLSIISLAQRFNSSLMLGDSDNIREYADADYVVFLMLLLVMVIPNCITFLQSIWVGGLGSHTPWPDNIGLCIIVLTSFLESTGMCIFVFGFLGDKEAVFSVIFMKMIFLITTAYNLYRCLSIGFSRIKKWSILFLFTLFFEISGIVLALYSHDKRYSDNWKQIAFPLLSQFTLSIAWLPPLQKRQVTPRSLPQRANHRAKKNLIYKNLDIETARWKAGAIAAFCKVIFTVCIAFAVNNQLVQEIHSRKMLATTTNWRDHPAELQNFLTNLCSSFIGILVAYVTCKISLDVMAFGFPLYLSGLLSFLILTITVFCDIFQKEDIFYLVANCSSDNINISLTMISIICLVVAELLASWYIIWRADTNLLPKDSAIFLMPGYNAVMLEEWIVLNRHREPVSFPIDFKERVKNSKIYICTTMYREADYEMKQLLESVNRVNMAQFESIRHFESHIFFDGGVKGSKPTEFALQLLSLLPTTLAISPKDCKQLKTPYGICLKWRLPAPGGMNRMKFCIHLKDNLKVKNKKRWSQVMYMSYVLDYLLKEQHDSENSEGFILTTDADVFFTPDSVEALLDLMTRDESIGAVCARTYPLGSGPLIWYQKFEYAIGHWFQKSAEDILGSVLCSPGCFSVYRCDAIMDVLPTYSTTVSEAFDFLIKDMGEDRWFCTLMLQSGWRIDYCAVANNSTHCPDGFDEFFKQRRRWIVSTIANLILVVKESRLMMKFNRHISVFFIIYQFVLLLATVIGPATVILVVSGGLQYGWSISPTYSIIIQYVVSAIFIIICLSCSGDFQLKVAKSLTFIYAIIMTVVTIGTIVQVVDDLNKDYDPDSDVPPVSISDIYLFALIAIFVLSSLCHLQEFTNLLNGIWYLLCLPTGYLILIMYSICNLTDKSWGTREDSSASTDKETVFLRSCFNMLKNLFPCCRTGEEKRSGSGSLNQPPHTPTLLKPGGEDMQSTSEIEISINMDGDAKHDTVDGQHLSVEYGVKVIPVQEWLPDTFKDLYAQYFIKNGYDDTRLISGMQEKELIDIGIKSKGHRQYVMDMIKLLPDFEPDTEVPESALIWLQNIGLSMYQENFKRNCIIYRRDMAVLKTMSSFDIKKELKIIKKGHIKKLQMAIKKLLDPTEAERIKIKIKRDLSMTRMVDLGVQNQTEDDFWRDLVQVCLDPSSAFSREEELKGKLGDLRNNWTLVIAVSNTIWLVLLATMASQANLAVYSSNPLGFVFLAVFGFIFVLQFLCMLLHRMGTLMHMIARSPYKFGAGFKTSWSFSDKKLRKRNDNDRRDFESDIVTGRRIQDFENSQRQLGNP